VENRLAKVLASNPANRVDEESGIRWNGEEIVQSAASWFPIRKRLEGEHGIGQEMELLGRDANGMKDTTIPAIEHGKMDVWGLGIQLSVPIGLAAARLTQEPEIARTLILGEIVDLEQHAAEAVAEVIPLADKVTAKAATDDSPGLPQTPVLEVSGEDPSESETLGADILELVADEASEPETTQDEPPEDITLADESAFEEKAENPPDLTPDGSVIEDGELEAIILTSDDEVQAGTPSSPENIEEAVKTEAPEKPVELAAPTAEVAAKSEDSSTPDEAQAKADAIQKQTEAHASLAAVKIEKAAQGLAEAQNKDKATSEATLLKEQKIARSKAQVLKIQKQKLAKAQALKLKKAALVKAQALKKQQEAQTGIEKANTETATGSTMAQSMEANTKMMGLLKKYEGQAIGINYDNSADIKEAELVEANDEFFSVFVKDQNLNYSHPLKTILTIIEGQDGVETGTAAQKAKFKAVVKVYPLVLF